MKWPKVSVVISTYDRPKLLRRALDSVLAQTFKNYEILVVDDGSNTAVDVCKEFLEQPEADGVRLRVAALERNSGYQSVPKNVGIHNSRGSYIAYLDDDNEWDSWHLETLVDEIEKGGADLVYSRWRYKGDGPSSGEEFQYSPATPAALAGLVQGPQFNFVDTSAILHSKAAVVAALGVKVWNEEIRRFGDWDMVARCAVAGVRMRGVDRVTFTYWWHGENLQLTRSPDEKVTEAASVEWRGGDSVWHE